MNFYGGFMEESLELVPDAVYGLNDGLIGKKLTYFFAQVLHVTID